MEIILLAIGKTSQDFVIDGINEYLKRLKRYVAYSIVCLSDVKGAKSLAQDLQKEKEGTMILSQLSDSDLCVLLDERGKEYCSRDFATTIQKWMASGKKRIVFVVGGPYGFSEAVYRRSDAMVSLSKMTFTHEMVRLFFTEQVYRAMTILKGEPYHHD